eukprot:183107-Ditylum_brightwellii.AAC.1
MYIDIKNRLRIAKADKEQVVRAWKEKNQKEEDRKKGGQNTLPKFILYISTKKWGPMHDRVEALVVIIQCTVENAPYLKTILSAAYKQGLIKCGTFVPQGFHRMAGEEEFKNKLHSHNEYVKLVTSVKIFGLTLDAMYANVVIDGEDMFLEDYINWQIPYIKKVERTKKTKSEGCWLIICSKANVPKEDKIEGHRFPVRAKSSGNKAIGTYVEALTKNSSAPKSYLQKTFNKQNNTMAVRRGTKRIMVTTEEENDYQNNGPE